MLNTLVNNYLSTAKGLPFFYSVSDDEYISTLEALKQSGLGVIKLSDFCKSPDKFPSLDELIDSFRLADVDCKSNKYVLIGLGEYLALKGEQEAVNILRKLKSTTLGTARVVILLRFVQGQIESVVAEDIRLKAQRYYSNRGQQKSVSVVNFKTTSGYGFVKEDGIKSLLVQLENGCAGRLMVKSVLDLSQSIIPVLSVSNSYEVLKMMCKEINIPQTLGTEEQWNRLILDASKHHNSIDAVFENNGIDEYYEQEFIERAFGYEYKNWLLFIYLKANLASIKNPYIKFVLEKTDKFADFKIAVLNSIIDVSHKATNFKSLYLARKKLLKSISVEDAAIFVKENEIDPVESIYHFTDNTIIEKQAIIRWISEYGIIPEIEDIYPALATYLKSYTFDCGSLSPLLTDYFDRYKRQKVQNKIDDDFLSAVVSNSIKYATLDTRANALASIDDKKSSFLYWIDALGVEYLSYIQFLAKAKGLSIKIDIVRADLPTITSINKGFYDEWVGGGKDKQPELDNIKHKDIGGFDYGKCKAPIHLANELEVIENAIKTAATELAMHTCKKFIIASDHGASRLAVIAGCDEKYPTDTKGEHSGRCCKYFEDYDIENCVSENGYIVLTNYGRFKGSRAANVEVHGGATLEETVIPIITLSLKTREDVSIRVLNADNIVVDRKNGVVINLYISFVESLENVRLILKGKTYQAKCIDENHYSFSLSDIKRSGKYTAEVYDGTNLIGNITFTVKGAVGSTNSGFDDLF